MNFKPKVSLIIPVFNGEKHLSKAIESSINQSLEDIEVIIIDDGSTDKTPLILDDFKRKDSRIKVYTQEKNKGLGPTRNFGIEKATGEYLSFLDADDYLHPNAMESLYEQAKAENLDLLQSKYIHKTQKSKKILPDDLIPLPKPVSGTEYFHQTFFISPTSWAKLYKTDFLKSHQIKFPNIYYEDMPFVFEAISKAHRVSNNLMPTYIYQATENSITSNFTQKHLEDYIKVLENLQAYFMQSQLTDKYASFPVQYYLFLARLSDKVIRFGTPKQKKKVKDFVEKQAKKYKVFLSKNRNYPFLKRMLLQASPYNYALLSHAFRPKKHCE